LNQNFAQIFSAHLKSCVDLQTKDKHYLRCPNQRHIFVLQIQQIHSSLLMISRLIFPQASSLISSPSPSTLITSSLANYHSKKSVPKRSRWQIESDKWIRYNLKLVNFTRMNLYTWSIQLNSNLMMHIFIDWDKKDLNFAGEPSLDSNELN
jgi:hypothetical protein